MALMNPLGTMIGFVLPLIFINSGDSKDKIKDQFLYHMISQAIAAGVLLVFTALFFMGDKEQKVMRGSAMFGTLVPIDQYILN